MDWYYEEEITGNPATPGYSLTVSGGELLLEVGTPYENAMKVIDIPTGANFTFSFDVSIAPGARILMEFTIPFI